MEPPRVQNVDEKKIENTSDKNYSLGVTNNQKCEIKNQEPH